MASDQRHRGRPCRPPDFGLDDHRCWHGEGSYFARHCFRWAQTHTVGKAKDFLLPVAVAGIGVAARASGDWCCHQRYFGIFCRPRHCFADTNTTSRFSGLPLRRDDDDDRREDSCALALVGDDENIRGDWKDQQHSSLLCCARQRWMETPRLSQLQRFPNDAVPVAAVPPKHRTALSGLRRRRRRCRCRHQCHRCPRHLSARLVLRPLCCFRDHCFS
mmetsp:Transcript_30402/g.71735  ORF Transcript_30402/g.71735 Transcript_30402/m.71735 type:complete len:217 (-) Transcript_30402:225-875(-)